VPTTPIGDVRRQRGNDAAEVGKLESKNVGYHSLYFECHETLIIFSNAIAENILLTRQFSARRGFPRHRGGGWKANEWYLHLYTIS